jgi:hypothetical protein
MSAHNAFDDSEPDDADDDDEVNDPSLQFAQLSIKEGEFDVSHHLLCHTYIS